MDKTRIKYLLEQYANNLASKEEVEEMFALMDRSETDATLKDLIVNAAKKEETEIELPGQHWNKMWSVIQSATIQQPKKQQVFSMSWMRVAAAVILFVIAGAVYFFVNQKKETKILAATTHYKNDVLPGGNKATLTLADGSVIVLDSMQNGTLTQQGNTMIVKAADGQLVYHANAVKANEILYNTVSTPSGGSYRLTLPDGSGVWLNASSSLRFPAAFTGKERNVELTGEAYFEVAKVSSPEGGGREGAAMPFHVKVSSMDVKVLGTHFNIMAYPNEQTINTTLLEGKVKVTQDKITKELEPGMQAIVDKQTHTIKITNANTDLSVGWKNNVFRFRETGIKDLMRQVERWYNVEVEYRTSGDDQNYTGVVPRTQNVSALLQTLELTGTVHFLVEKSDVAGKAGKIIVLP